MAQVHHEHHEEGQLSHLRKRSIIFIADAVGRLSSPVDVDVLEKQKEAAQHVIQIVRNLLFVDCHVHDTSRDV